MRQMLHRTKFGKASDEYNASSVHTLTVELVDDVMISPYSLNINPMLWLDTTDSSLMDTGFELVDNIPSSGQKVGFGKDKSGRGYDAISKNHPIMRVVYLFIGVLVLMTKISPTCTLQMTV